MLRSRGVSQAPLSFHMVGSIRKRFSVCCKMRKHEAGRYKFAWQIWRNKLWQFGNREKIPYFTNFANLDSGQQENRPRIGPEKFLLSPGLAENLQGQGRKVMWDWALHIIRTLKYGKLLGNTEPVVSCEGLLLVFAPWKTFRYRWS